MVTADFVKGVATMLFATGGGVVAFYFGKLHERGVLLEKTSNFIGGTKQIVKNSCENIYEFIDKHDIIKVPIAVSLFIYGMAFCIGSPIFILCYLIDGKKL